MSTTYVRGSRWHEVVGTTTSSGRAAHAAKCGGAVIVGAPTTTSKPPDLCPACEHGVPLRLLTMRA